MATVNSLLTDTPISRQLYLHTLFSIPLSSYWNNSRKQAARYEQTLFPILECVCLRESWLCYVAFGVGRWFATFFLRMRWIAQQSSHGRSNFSWTILCKGKGAMRLTLHVCEAPTHETRPDHNTENYTPYSFSRWLIVRPMMILLSVSYVCHPWLPSSKFWSQLVRKQEITHGMGEEGF